MKRKLVFKKAYTYSVLKHCEKRWTASIRLKRNYARKKSANQTKTAKTAAHRHKTLPDTQEAQCYKMPQLPLATLLFKGKRHIAAA